MNGLIVAVAACAFACAGSRAELVKESERGGMVWLEGPDENGPARLAVAVMSAKCGGQFTVTSIESTGPRFVAGPWFSRVCEFSCGAAGTPTPLTARVLAWGAEGEKAEQKRQAKAAEIEYRKKTRTCMMQLDCEAGEHCIDGICRM